MYPLTSPAGAKTLGSLFLYKHQKSFFQRLRDVGAFLTTSECLILGLAADSAHPKFKSLQKLCMTVSEDTGLLGHNV